ncbi:HPP family protein [Sphingobium boeckii]|nr:HPP family protein [Sphingobium boeckii]
MRLFAPLLAGGSLRDRLIACLGTMIGIIFVGMTSVQLSPESLPWLVAPIGASAVLLFAVPSSPLAQPWSIVGGNVSSALTGIAINGMIHPPIVAAAVAVSAAILVMSLSRCLHPPGGAVALSAVLGGHVFGGHPEMLITPDVLNSALLVFIGWLLHRYSGHSYPHRAVPMVWRTVAPAPDSGFMIGDIDRALEDLGETFDVSREDLALLFSRAEAHAAIRQETHPSESR